MSLLVSLLKEIAQCFCSRGPPVSWLAGVFVGLWLPALQGSVVGCGCGLASFLAESCMCGGGASACVRHQSRVCGRRHGHLFSLNQLSAIDG